MSHKRWYAKERVKAIQHAETYLTNFCVLWPMLPYEDLPGLVKGATFALVIVYLASPVKAEVRLKDVAKAAGVPELTLRMQVTERVQFFRGLDKRLARSDKAKDELVRMIVE